jgi:hypothetical protein
MSEYGLRASAGSARAWIGRTFSSSLTTTAWSPAWSIRVSVRGGVAGYFEPALLRDDHLPGRDVVAAI